MNLFDPRQDRDPKGVYLFFLVAFRVVNVIFVWFVVAEIFLGHMWGYW